MGADASRAYDPRWHHDTGFGPGSPRLWAGAAASGMGNAFAAQADNPSALHYNPAGMTQLRGIQLMGGLSLVGGATDFRSPTGVTTTGDHDGTIAWPGPGHGYLTANLQDLGLSSLGNVTVGIGITTPFGSVMRWPDNSPLRTISTFTALPLFDIKPTIAYQVTQDFSIGAGADIYTFAGFSEKDMLNCSQFPGGLVPAGGKLEFNGKGTAPGFNVGDCIPRFEMAQDSRSQILPWSTEARPPPLGWGFFSQWRQDPRRNDHLGVTPGHHRWYCAMADPESRTRVESGVERGLCRLEIRQKSRYPSRKWIHDSTAAKLEKHLYHSGWNGVQVAPTERLPGWEVSVRGGYTNQQTQVPDLTFNPGVPSADLHVISSGIGLICRENGSFLGLIPCGGLGVGPVKPKLVGLDLFYQAFLYEPRTISGVSGVRAPVNGRYDTILHAGGLSIRVSF